MGLGEFRVWDWTFWGGAGQRAGLTYKVMYWPQIKHRLRFFGSLGLDLGTLGLGLGLNRDRRKVRANMQSDVLVPKQHLGFSRALGLGLGDFRFRTEALRGRVKGQNQQTK